MENSMIIFLEKLKIELYYLAILLLGISKGCLYTYIHISTLHQSQKAEATQVSISVWMVKKV